MSLTNRAKKGIIKELWMQIRIAVLKRKMEEIDRDPKKQKEYEHKWEKFKP